MFQRQWKHFILVVTCRVPEAVETFCPSSYLSCFKGCENVLPYWLPIVFQRQWKRFALLNWLPVMFQRQWKSFALLVTCHVLKAVKPFVIVFTCRVPEVVKTFCPSSYLSCSKGCENILPYWLPVMFQRQWRHFVLVVTCRVPESVKTFCPSSYLSCYQCSEGPRWLNELGRWI